jgi:hypothetical protein
VGVVLGQFQAPLHGPREPLLHKLDADDASGVNNRAKKVAVLVNTLQQELHVTIEQAGLDEELGLERERLGHFRSTLISLD